MPKLRATFTAVYTPKTGLREPWAMLGWRFPAAAYPATFTQAATGLAPWSAATRKSCSRVLRNSRARCTAEARAARPSTGRAEWCSVRTARPIAGCSWAASPARTRWRFQPAVPCSSPTPSMSKNFRWIRLRPCTSRPARLSGNSPLLSATKRSRRATISSSTCRASLPTSPWLSARSTAALCSRCSTRGGGSLTPPPLFF